MLSIKDIPPEDMGHCNNAEGCDDCKWYEVCHGKG
jgi:hypothetical protein